MERCRLGETVSLFTVFVDDVGQVVLADDGTAEARVLHEVGETIYEDMPWTIMSPLADGYVTAFDTSHVEPGRYTVVYRCTVAGKRVVTGDELTVVDEAPALVQPVVVHGVVHDVGTAKLLEAVLVTVTSPTGASEASVTTDFAGEWSASVAPGDHVFTFTLTGYAPRVVRAQVGDREAEVMFNHVALEPTGERSRGDGAFAVSDVFTDKYDAPLADLTLEIVRADDPATVIAESVTNQAGVWLVYLDPGSYVATAVTYAGRRLPFRLVVRGDGAHELTALTSPTAPVTAQAATLGRGTGGREVTDVVVDAHGAGIAGALVTAYVIGVEAVTLTGGDVRQTERFTAVADDVTDAEGRFTVNLDAGRYRLTVSAPGYVNREQVFTV